ncbi:MAG TPA: ABC transporter substrate-binding protein, partial [Methylomirabilota bacterium]|nr:ABC transporter substrate-binding protein [Methylomirabilota bacterium]
LAAQAQQAGKVPRIGYFDAASSRTNPDLTDAFRDQMRQLGYVEGKNLVIEYRWADGKYDRLPDLAADLVRLRVDVIVTVGDPVILAAKEATTTIPIVLASVGDPVGRGFVASLARPGGNITGVSNLAVALSGKWLEILSEAVPRLSQVAILRNVANPTHPLFWMEADKVAKGLGLKLQSLGVRTLEDIDAAFESMQKERVGAFVTLPDPLLTGQRVRIADLAAKAHLPGIAAFRENAETGTLMAYGPSLAANRRRAAVFVDKILKGAKPGDLPIEQPTKFELFINLKTAKALGLTIPPSLLQRADQVIE